MADEPRFTTDQAASIFGVPPEQLDERATDPRLLELYRAEEAARRERGDFRAAVLDLLRTAGVERVVERLNRALLRIGWR